MMGTKRSPIIMATVCISVFVGVGAVYDAKTVSCPKEIIKKMSSIFGTFSADFQQLSDTSQFSAKVTNAPTDDDLTKAAGCDEHNNKLRKFEIKLTIEYTAKETEAKDCEFKIFKRSKKVKPNGKLQNVEFKLVKGSYGHEYFSLKLSKNIKNDFIPVQECKNIHVDIRNAISTTFADLLTKAFDEKNVLKFVPCQPSLTDTIAALFKSFADDGIELPAANIPKLKNLAFVKAMRYRVDPPIKPEELLASIECTVVDVNYKENIQLASISVIPKDGIKVKVEGDRLDSGQLCLKAYAGIVGFLSFVAQWPGKAKLARDTAVKAEKSVACPDSSAVLEHGAEFDRMFQEGFWFDEDAGKATFKQGIVSSSALIVTPSLKYLSTEIIRALTIRPISVDLTLTLTDDTCTDLQPQQATTSLSFEVKGPNSYSPNVLLPEVLNTATTDNCAYELLPHDVFVYPSLFEEYESLFTKLIGSFDRFRCW